jgi:DNA polymerase-3 subunit beta
MEFYVNAKTLSTALNIVGRSIPSKPSHPILGSVKLDLQEGRAFICGFDLATAIIHTIDVDSVKGVGESICIPYRMLNDIFGRLDGDLFVSEIENGIQIKSDTGKYKLAVHAAADYPELPICEGERIALSGTVFKEAIATVGGCASSGETKQVLTGINLATTKGKLCFAATNGHVLSRYWSDGCSEDITATIPAHVLTAFARGLEEDLTLQMDEQQVCLSSGDVTVISRLLDGAYPDVTQLLPEDYKIKATVNGAELKSALNRLAVFTDPKNQIIKLSFGDRLTLSSEVQDIGNGVEQIDCELDGEAIELAGNLKYLQLGLNSLEGENLTFQINHPRHPVTVKANDHSIFLFMPIKLVE